MKTPFDFAYDAYLLRKQAEHQVRMRRLQCEMTGVPVVASARPDYFPAGLALQGA